MVPVTEDTIKPLFHFYVLMATIEQPYKHGLYDSNDKNNGYLQSECQMCES